MQGPLYGAPYSQPRSNGPRIGDWLSESFNLFGREWQTWCLQGLVAVAIIVLVQIVCAGLILFTIGAAAFRAGTSPDGSLGPSAMLAMYGAIYFSAFVALFPTYFLIAGMVRTAAKQLRGEPIAVGDLFSGGDVYLPVLGAGLLTSLFAGIGMIFCIVPGLLVGTLLFYAHPLIVERRLSVGDALRESWDAVKPHLWMNVLWVLLMYVIMNVGSAVGCGLIATMPIGILMWMVGYRETFGLEGAVPPPGAYQATMTPPGYGAQYGPAGPPTVGSACPACSRPVAQGAVVCPYCQASLTQQPQPGNWTPPPPPPPGPPAG